MGETSSQIEQDIRAERTELNHNIGELQSKLKTTFSWQEQVKQRPLVMFGIAVSAGALLAFVGSKTDGHQQPVGFSPAVSAEHADTGTATRQKKQQAMQAWDRAKAAFIGLAMSRTEQLLNDSVPGFRERYESTAQANTGFESAPAADRPETAAD